MSLERKYNEIELIPAVRIAEERIAECFLKAAKGDVANALEQIKEMPLNIDHLDPYVLNGFARLVTEGVEAPSSFQGHEVLDEIKGTYDALKRYKLLSDYARQGVVQYFNRPGVRENKAGEQEPYTLSTHQVLSYDVKKLAPGGVS